MPYIPAFDGLRALAAILVVAFHAKLGVAHAGFLGVDLFFVLSGFLITSILRAPDRGVDYAGFVIRRLERLYPAFLVFLVVFAIALSVMGGSGMILSEVIPAAFYVSNYTRLLTGEPDILRHTWSLAVEFQFYLIWPLCVVLLGRLSAGRAFGMVLLGYLVLTMWRVMVYGDFGWLWAYNATDARIGGLVLGGAIAFLPRASQRVAGGAEVVGAGMLVFALIEGRYYTPLTAFYYEPLAEIGSALVIYGLTAGQTRFSKALSFGPLRKLGHWSYGIYLWHYPVAFALRDTAGPTLTFVVALGVSVLMAALSYEFFETRIRDVLRSWRSLSGGAIGAFASRGR